MNTILKEDVRAVLGDALPWDRLKNSTVLITGAAGMIPAYFVHTLLGLNDRDGLGIVVLALVRNRVRAEKTFGGYLKRPDFTLLVQDVTQPVSYAGQIDYIVHGASQASPKYYGVDPVGTLNANVLGTNALLQLARQKQAKCFFFLSTGDVYGVPVVHTPVEESDYGYIDILNVRSCYNESKRLAETMCICWGSQYGLPVKIARITHTYGPGLRMDDGRVFADFSANIVRGENIKMFSDGRATRTFCYITDCVRAIYRILFFGEKGTAYNIANAEQSFSVLQLAEMLVALFPEKGLQVEMRKRETEGEDYLPSPLQDVQWNVSRLEELGWSPEVDAKEGFHRLIQYMQDT